MRNLVNSERLSSKDQRDSDLKKSFRKLFWSKSILLYNLERERVKSLGEDFSNKNYVGRLFPLLEQERDTRVSFTNESEELEINTVTYKPFSLELIRGDDGEVSGFNVNLILIDRDEVLPVEFLGEEIFKSENEDIGIIEEVDIYDAIISGLD